MKIVYADAKTEECCESMRKAEKFFGGNRALALSLHARINALRNAVTVRDIIAQPSFRFHKLNDSRKKKLNGCFAIDVKTRREPWRLILRPLDPDMKPFVPCNIDEISASVRIVRIEEVSNHYE